MSISFLGVMSIARLPKFFMEEGGRWSGALVTSTLGLANKLSSIC